MLILTQLSINFFPSAVAQFPSFSADSTPTHKMPKDVKRFGEIEVNSVKSPNNFENWYNFSKF
ncbi:hypothetical protein PCC7424_3436 [Gloeothece citriformis PCC 7424]|uniref:Uncharacterized protein n=1 Tax=Gloeothece citriformis (strain PCC 7424) TaxID=65393 RepID=B7KFB5_GLOC7|nr:hypothetical protein [Gloeothece citriformis]ACK71831.1 hypothetical protein PCC7424_3436 [Gloeothece citriformis PCC 7424]